MTEVVALPKVTKPRFAFVAKRLVLDAVVLKIVVSVALVLVLLRAVKFWRVDDPLTKRLAKLLLPEKVLLSPRSVEEAAPLREVR